MVGTGYEKDFLMALSLLRLSVTRFMPFALHADFAAPSPFERPTLTDSLCLVISVTLSQPFIQAPTASATG